MVTIELTPFELYGGAMTGINRQIESLRKGNKDNLASSSGSGFGSHVEGAIAEIALAKHLHTYFPFTVNTYHSQPDVFPNFDAKWRGREDDDMFVSIDAKDDTLYVLVTNKGFNYTLHGWATGAEVKQCPIKWPGGRPAHLVLQSQLHPIETLPFEHPKRSEVEVARQPRPATMADLKKRIASRGVISE